MTSVRPTLQLALAVSIACIYDNCVSAQTLFSVFAEEPFTWTEAKVMCNNSATRGQLVSSHNASYDHLIEDACQWSTSSSSCWSGLHRSAAEDDNWEWIDNTDLDYLPDLHNYADLESAAAYCATMSSGDSQPVWNVQDCAVGISGAVCSTCGELDEYCCNAQPSQCNEDHLQCVSNLCVESITIEPTKMYTSTTPSDQNIKVTIPDDARQHQKWSIQTAVMMVFFVCMCGGFAAYVKKTNRRKVNKQRIQDVPTGPVTPVTPVSTTQLVNRVNQANFGGTNIV